jgi:hypothetical protein
VVLVIVEEAAAKKQKEEEEGEEEVMEVVVVVVLVVESNSGVLRQLTARGLSLGTQRAGWAAIYGGDRRAKRTQHSLRLSRLYPPPQNPKRVI